MNIGSDVRVRLTSNRNRKKLTTLIRGALLSAVLLNILLLPVNLRVSVGAAAAQAAGLNVWWPTDGAHVEGVQPFKAQLGGVDNSQYQMFWQVDGGQLNPMSDNTTDAPHKEASVDVSSWSWRGSGPYVVTFVAQQNGATVAQQSVTIYVDNGLPAQTAVPQPAQSQTQVPTLSTDPDPVHAQQMAVLVQAVQSGADTDPVHIAQVQAYLGQSVSTQPVQTSPILAAPNIPVSQASGFWIDPNSDIAQSGIAALAGEPTAKWFGGWSGDIESAANAYVSTTAQAGKMALMVAYNIPGRDCGGYSSGGAQSQSDYVNWIGGLARGIGNRPAMVILEPDALAGLDCLSLGDQAAREQMLSSAVSILKSNGNTKVYLDAGNASWQTPQTMAARLSAAGIGNADGFSLNVSNFQTTSDSTSYGQQISAQVGGKHFLIDTSRNGNGSSGQWCNPSGRHIGNAPTMQTGNSLVDAYVWAKVPGESDGTCNGGPAAGVWWQAYALSLVQ